MSGCLTGMQPVHLRCGAHTVMYGPVHRKLAAASDGDKMCVLRGKERVFAALVNIRPRMLNWVTILIRAV